MHAIDQLKIFITYLEKQAITKEPENLYEPSHILGIVESVRPVLTLMTTEVLMEIIKALPAAMAVEVFHNFSLVHDDIMDDAPLRRGT
jgi:geranylgeranyl diphosphate synthase type II